MLAGLIHGGVRLLYKETEAQDSKETGHLQPTCDFVKWTFRMRT